MPVGSSFAIDMQYALQIKIKQSIQIEWNEYKLTTLKLKYG